MDSWPFEASRNTATITIRQVLEDGAPVLLVTHDADDGGWQFLSGMTVDPADARVVGLGEMCDRDPTLWELGRLARGLAGVARAGGGALAARAAPVMG